LVFFARPGSGGDKWFCGKYGGGLSVGIAISALISTARLQQAVLINPLL